MKILGEINAGFILIIIIVAAALIALIAFIIYRVTHPKLKNKEKKDEKECAKEELDRILQPVEDDKIAQEINDYKDSDE